MLASLAACGSSPAASDTAEGTTAPEVTDTTAPEAVEMLPDVEKKDYDGAIFNIRAPVVIVSASVEKIPQICSEKSITAIQANTVYAPPIRVMKRMPSLTLSFSFAP